ncbi:MAG: OsmC family protein [Robiginitomaculum sp.]|nr:OsmC family protein [Robiginitomaculum sp.]MDQ7077285.1 OsmC family protein [Robiginitomaculum sp.]
MSGHVQRTAKVGETGNGLYQNDIQIGDHHLIAGEPRELGGDDSGPTPMELAAAALGACTTTTLRMYANRKDWPLKHISATVTHKKGPREICATDDDDTDHKPGLVDIFTRTITLEGPLSEEQRERLLQIADKCPVHKALSGSSCVRTLTANA